MLAKQGFSKSRRGGSNRGPLHYEGVPDAVRARRRAGWGASPASRTAARTQSGRTRKFANVCARPTRSLLAGAGVRSPTEVRPGWPAASGLPASTPRFCFHLEGSTRRCRLSRHFVAASGISNSRLIRRTRSTSRPNTRLDTAGCQERPESYPSPLRRISGPCAPASQVSCRTSDTKAPSSTT